MPPAVHITLTPRQIGGLLRVLDRARPHLPLPVPDPATRDAVIRATEALRRAASRAEAPAASPATPSPALDGLLDQMQDPHAPALFAARARDVRAAAALWIGLEEAADVAWSRGDAEAVQRCAALLAVDAIDDPGWRADALELIEALGVAPRPAPRDR